MWIDHIHKMLVTNWFFLLAVIAGFIFLKIQGDWTNPYLWCGIAVQVGVAIFLIQINSHFAIIRTRTLLPGMMFLLLALNLPLTEHNLTESLITLGIAVNFFLLFLTYQEPESQVHSFDIAVLLTVGSLFWPPLLFFFPIFWIGFFRFQSLTWKVFLASLTGIIVVELCIFAWSVYCDDIDIFLSLLPPVSEMITPEMPVLNIYEWVIIGFALLLLIWEGFNLFVSGISETVKTVSILNYLYYAIFLMFTFSLLKNNSETQWESLTAIPASFILAHFFTTTNNRLTKLLMIVYFAFMVVTGLLLHSAT
ncbi:MAG: hypothetical protein LBR64_08420 [Dysgonamonadaceae bacterium]|jgi:hypothetical protein|nr:hypothetical protein [Dysgonamonadaceae bacterium]